MLDVIRKNVFRDYGQRGNGESSGNLDVILVDCRAEIIANEKGCEATWFWFKSVVVNGWPIDMIRFSKNKLVYETLGVITERKPMKDESSRLWWQGRDGLLAWWDEARFDIDCWSDPHLWSLANNNQATLTERVVSETIVSAYSEWEPYSRH
jgi:hypothetical protein